LAENSGSGDIFPVVMAAIVQAVDKHGDLMRMAIAPPGNDFRLGACEAPPSIMSMYLGEDLTTYLDSYRNGNPATYVPNTRDLNLGASVLPNIQIPAEDRNRTSPFPYGGHRFEFRAVGSSQNVSLVNTVLAMITAKAFKDFADSIEKGASPRDVAQRALNDSWKVIFNGNGYDPMNQKALTEAGLWRFDSGVDAINRFTVQKNVEIFQELNILTPEECAARKTILLRQYVGTVEIEAQVLVDMIQQHIIPAVKTAGVGSLADLQAAVATLQRELSVIHHADTDEEKARLVRILRLETMLDIRKLTDATEAVIPARLWTIATYKELLFIDQNTV